MNNFNDDDKSSITAIFYLLCIALVVYIVILGVTRYYRSHPKQVEIKYVMPEVEKPLFDPNKEN